MSVFPLSNGWLWFWRIMAILAMLVIGVLSLLPPSELQALPKIHDKLGHFIAYLTIALLMSFGWRRAPLWSLWLIASGFGVAAELGQGYLTSARAMEWWDAVANGAGALVGVALGGTLRKYFLKPAAH